jgi:hypothetical protein
MRAAVTSLHTSSNQANACSSDRSGADHNISQVPGRIDSGGPILLERPWNSRLIGLELLLLSLKHELLSNGGSELQRVL